MIFSISLYSNVQINDYIQTFLRPFRILITLFGGYSLTYILYKKNYSTNQILDFVFLSIVIHAVIMIYQLYDSSFKDWIYSYTTTGEFRGSNEYEFRMGGLSGGTGSSTLSVSQSIGVLMLPFLLTRANLFRKIIFISLGLLVFYSIIITGRSGVLSILLFLPLSLYLSNPKIKFSMLLKNFLGIFGFIGLIFFTINFLSEMDNESTTFYAISRSLDTIINAKETGIVEDNTSKELLNNHLLFPEDSITFLFGNGEHLVNTQFERTLHSDIGYIRNLWSFGIFGAIIFWMPYFYYMIISLKLAKRHQSAAILCLISAVTILFQSKENFMYSRILFSMYSIMIAIFYFDIKRDSFLKNTGQKP
jgi:hypothetical protein